MPYGKIKINPPVHKASVFAEATTDRMADKNCGKAASGFARDLAATKGGGLGLGLIGVNGQIR